MKNCLPIPCALLSLSLSLYDQHYGKSDGACWRGGCVPNPGLVEPRWQPLHTSPIMLSNKQRGKKQQKQKEKKKNKTNSSHYTPVVSESRFFNLETRMRVSPIQSRSSRRDQEFLTLTLRLRDETEKKFPPILGIETRSRFIIFTLRLRDENENSLDLILFFETRPRILNVAIFP